MTFSPLIKCVNATANNLPFYRFQRQIFKNTLPVGAPCPQIVLESILSKINCRHFCHFKQLKVPRNRVIKADLKPKMLKFAW